MLEAVAQLGGALRHSGAPVSPAQMAVALEALVILDPADLGDRDQVRRALRQTLVSRRADLDVFERLFDAIFAASSSLDGGETIADDLAAALGRDAAAELLAALAAELPELAGLFGVPGADIDPSTSAADAVASAVASVRSSLQLGAAAYRAGAALGLDRASEVIARLARDRLGAGDAEVAAGLVSRHVARIRETLRTLAGAALTVNRPTERRDLLAETLVARPFAALTPSEIDDLSEEVRRLARQLIAQVLRRRAAPRSGRLDVARTLRASMSTDGVPFTPRFRRRQRRRPQLVILCDISDSVRNVSRFMLQLTYTMARLFDGVRAFAFVDELGELTSLFRRHSVKSAVELAAGGAVVNVLANSNYGNAFAEFTARHLSVVTRRSTVIVIGDGRTNYHDPGLRHLAAIRARAGRLWWMNPEPEPVWGFGDSAMREYETLCDHVAVVGSLTSLKRVVDDLLRS